MAIKGSWSSSFCQFCDSEYIHACGDSEILRDCPKDVGQEDSNRDPFGTIILEYLNLRLGFPVHCITTSGRRC